VLDVSRSTTSVAGWGKAYGAPKEISAAAAAQ
jgi:hypothetical protein